MKRISRNFLFSILLLSASFSVFAADFSGVYKCTGFGVLDGKYITTITFKKNKDFNKPKSAYETYDMIVKNPALPYNYTGYAIAYGSNLAVYFESSGPKKDASDKGVAMDTITEDLDSKGKEIVSLHNFFYQKNYNSKVDYGTENCILSK